MPRTKDAVRHAELAAEQVTEALNLLWRELKAAKRERSVVDERVQTLNAQFVKVRDAAVSLGIDLGQLDAEDDV